MNERPSLWHVACSALGQVHGMLTTHHPQEGGKPVRHARLALTDLIAGGWEMLDQPHEVQVQAALKIALRAQAALAGVAALSASN